MSIGIHAIADDLTTLESLIRRGNEAYTASQPSRMKECADSAAHLLAKGKIKGDDFIEYSAAAYRLYGDYHNEREALDSAETYYIKAQEIIDNNPNTSFRDMPMHLSRDMAQLYYRQQRYAKAAEMMRSVNDYNKYNELFEQGSDDWLNIRMALAICLARMKDFDQAIRMSEEALESAEDKDGTEYIKSQRTYAKILMLADADRQGALKAYKSYFDNQKRYALDNFSHLRSSERDEYWHTLRPFMTDCYRLENEDPGFLYDVTLFSKGLLLQLSRISGDDVASEEALRTLKYTWKDIQKRLKPADTAIEFIQYEKDGEQRMAALLLKSSGKPQFISLTKPSDILSVAGKGIQSTSRADKDDIYNNTLLQNLVWTDPLMKSVIGTKRLFFAPDGYMHRLAIEYMPKVENMELYRLTSTRRLMENPDKLTKDSPALLLGGINYELDRAIMEGKDNDPTAYSHYIGKYFPNLSEGSNEAKMIYEMRENAKDSLILATRASEGMFRNLAPHYENILISTHGDLCAETPTASDIKPVDMDESMSRNIIALAGVNSHLEDKEFNATSTYDGILSAKELSELDLSNCKLITVSACQSGLGEISSDGVYGLQRGLKNAGAGSMLLSLWNVNTDATAMLMSIFHRNLNDGMTIRKAFSAAREELASKEFVYEEYVSEFDPKILAGRSRLKRTVKTFDSPQFTNAFILIDALE